MYSLQSCCMLCKACMSFELPVTIPKQHYWEIFKPYLDIVVMCLVMSNAKLFSI